MKTMENMKHKQASGRSRLGSLPFLLAGLLGLVALTNPLHGKPGSVTTGGRTNAVTFSGQAYAVKASVPTLGISTVISDTGGLPGSGGQLEASLLDVDVPGLLSAEVAHASTIGQGDRSRSEASLANLNLAVG